MVEAQENRLPVRTWLKMAGFGLIAALGLARMSGQWSFLLDALPVLGLCVALGGIRFIARVREDAVARSALLAAEKRSVRDERGE